MASSPSLADSFVFVPSSASDSVSTASSLVSPTMSDSLGLANDHDAEPSATFALKMHGRHFVDDSGRVVHLRGVNLSGSCKAPVNDDHSAFPANPEAATFVGRPFPLEEADEHFARLKSWGFTFIRFLITWEAVEHAGPGIYDEDYLSYLHSLLLLLPKYSLVAFISMHQDVWSRYSGGSGAPAWTLTSVGFDLDKLEDAGAAWLKGVRGGGHTEDERGIWPCGYQKLAAGTMATCFWAGDTFAPKLKIRIGTDGEVGVQHFLQDTFLNMWAHVARRLGVIDGVIGFEMMNEPHRGYISVPSLHDFAYETDLHLSHVPSAFQSFLLGAGHPTEVKTWTRSYPLPTRHTAMTLLNPNGVKVWKEDGPTGGKCIWENEGLWGWDTRKEEGVVLREHYFLRDPRGTKLIDWYTDFYYPFIQKWAERVKAEVPNGDRKIIFTEPIPNEYCPESWTSDRQPPNMVYAPHWYDLNALFNKAFGNVTVNVQGIAHGMFVLRAFYWGQVGARDNYALQIRNIVEAGYRVLGEKPVIIGECGIPMDMNKGAAFKNGDWTYQLRMMDALMTALERSLVGFTLWNYNPSNDDVAGDDWNGENFSWVGLAHRNGRILRSVVRPYPAKTAGIPTLFDYEPTTGLIRFKWVVPASTASPFNSGGSPSVDDPPIYDPQHPALNCNETELFLPSMLYASRSLSVTGLSAGDSWKYDAETQVLTVTTSSMEPGKRYAIKLMPATWVSPGFQVNSFARDFSRIVVPVWMAGCMGVVLWRGRVSMTPQDLALLPAILMIYWSPSVALAMMLLVAVSQQFGVL